MLASIRRRATGRNVVVAILLTLVFGRVIAWVMIPAYSAAAAGFVPLDVQPRLSREMLAIQRGAFSPGVEIAYARYAVAAVIYALLAAVTVAIGWTWIMTAVPRPLFVALERGGLAFLPYLAGLCAMAESLAFLALMLSDSHDPQFRLMETALAIHRVKFALFAVVKGTTAIMLALAVTFHFRGRRS